MATAGFDVHPENINRKGAPKREWTWSGLLEYAMELQNSDGVPHKITIVSKLIEMAQAGDIVALKEILNRMDGMPQQHTDLTTLGKELPAPIYGSKAAEDVPNS